jgi:hypothetical protein
MATASVAEPFGERKSATRIIGAAWLASPAASIWRDLITCKWPHHPGEANPEGFFGLIFPHFHIGFRGR